MKIRPLHDRLLVERLEEKEVKKGGIIIPGHGQGEGGDARTRAPPGSRHRPSAVRAWRFWLDDRITRLESLRCSLRSSLGPRTEHAREPGEADWTPPRRGAGTTAGRGGRFADGGLVRVASGRQRPRLIRMFLNATTCPG